jgi:hypothetical protein
MKLLEIHNLNKKMEGIRTVNERQEFVKPPQGLSITDIYKFLRWCMVETGIQPIHIESIIENISGLL